MLTLRTLSRGFFALNGLVFQVGRKAKTRPDGAELRFAPLWRNFHKPNRINCLFWRIGRRRKTEADSARVITIYKICFL